MLEHSIPKGRPTIQVTCHPVRDLTAEDLELVRAAPRNGYPRMKALRERHHAVARHLAAGLSRWEIAGITGYNPQVITILQSDPTFMELVSFYAQNIQAQYSDLHANLAGLSADAVAIMRERLEESPDNVSDARLTELIKLGADRTGHGPSSTQTVNVNVGLAQRLEAARKRIAERTIDITPERKVG